MSISDKIRKLKDQYEDYVWLDQKDLDALADEVAELEKREVPKGWMPYRLVNNCTEDVVIVMPDGWFLWRIGDPDKSTHLGDFRLPFQEAIALAEAAKEKTP